MDIHDKNNALWRSKVSPAYGSFVKKAKVEISTRKRRHCIFWHHGSPNWNNCFLLRSCWCSLRRTARAMPSGGPATAPASGATSHGRPSQPLSVSSTSTTRLWSSMGVTHATLTQKSSAGEPWPLWIFFLVSRLPFKCDRWFTFILVTVYHISQVWSIDIYPISIWIIRMSRKNICTHKALMKRKLP